MNNWEVEIDKLIAGELTESEANELMEKINADPSLKKFYLSEKASKEVFEYQIRNDTRALMAKLLEKEQKQSKESPKSTILYFTGIAASLLILIVSVVTINLSHSDTALADEFNINVISSRNGATFSDSNFTQALKAYFLNDFKTAKEKLALPAEEESLVVEYKDWLSLMILLKTEGSDSMEFQNQFQAILNDENHEFYIQAVKLNKELQLFWRNFVVRK